MWFLVETQFSKTVNRNFEIGLVPCKFPASVVLHMSFNTRKIIVSNKNNIFTRNSFHHINSNAYGMIENERLCTYKES